MSTTMVGALVLAVGMCGARRAESQTRDALAAQVRAAETAFARTMAARDYDAFASFVADEALF